MVEKPSKGLISSCIEILEDLGYEVTKKEPDIAIGKLPYKWYCFNKIESIDLDDIDGITCVFLTEQGYEELKYGGYTSSTEICTGYIRYYEDADENLLIYIGSDNNIPLKNFKYVTRLDDLISSLEDQEKYFAQSYC